MPKNTTKFSNNLILWYLQNGRDLPWRSTKDPYHIWLSEIMLQQTRVAQGLPYYEKFIRHYPTVHDLANAPEDAVLKDWQGLGYYSRARNLHATAQKVSTEMKGQFPNTFKGLLALKGVGDYTASAIASICFDLPTAVVDGNVYRVLSRYFGIDTPINSSAGIKEFKALAQELIDYKQPGTFNQAVMEFGARHCVPQNPDCASCVLKDSCVALKKDKVGTLPVKLAKTKVKHLHFNYMVMLSPSGSTILEKRTQKGIWQNLFQFPLIESSEPLTHAALLETEGYKKLSQLYSIEEVVVYNETPVIHKLSHRHLHTVFWIVSLASEPPEAIASQQVAGYAVPVLIANFISEFSPLNP